MQTAQPRELVVTKRLDAVTQSIHTGRAKPLEPFRGHGLGIGFERNLGVGIQRERAAALLDELADFGRFEQRRGAAAEEDRVSRRAVGDAPNLLPKRADVPRFQGRIKESPIEVAVVANGRAERYVDIN